MIIPSQLARDIFPFSYQQKSNSKINSSFSMIDAQNIAKATKKSMLETVKINSEIFFKITNNHNIRPFFMSIVSDSNHWMFISSNGGLSAGRKNVDFALFPYYTDDKITEGFENTGSKSLFRIAKNGTYQLWEPFSERGQNSISRNLYKSHRGNKIVFEEINHDLEMTFRYMWSSSNGFGFVKESSIINNSPGKVQISLLDGIENIMPYGVPEKLQSICSNLADAYKRSELDSRSGLGIFALSAIIVDRAEPSEALKANIAWSTGLEKPTYLVSSKQVDAFRRGHALVQEEDIKAERGAYFVSKEIKLDSNGEKKWAIIANVNQDATDIEALSYRIQHEPNFYETILSDINKGTDHLKKLVAASDGLQKSADSKRDARHYSNTLFNIMRGGIFDHNYQIEKWDFSKYLKKASKAVFKNQSDTLKLLPKKFSYSELNKVAKETKDLDFVRLAIEYLPLKFSRRHGDPSRPWNKFSINTVNEDGTKVLDYEGNWRDIFQNWEALATSYPLFIKGMIAKFLNASTFDGYNPYRITKDGFDWETIEPDDPWSFIGYWGDHQIIYLLKFLEISENHYPGQLASFFTKEIFAYANVPYKIKSYKDILRNPKDTIEFDEPLDSQINKDRETHGGDGTLSKNVNGTIHHVNFIEKILAISLAKLTNYIPEGGIWLNTQRPEWNDANNALVGNGVSMVTLYYLRRFFTFLQSILKKRQSVDVSAELAEFYQIIHQILERNTPLLSSAITDEVRKQIMDELGTAGSNYRNTIYTSSFSGKRTSINTQELLAFSGVVLQHLDHSIKGNKRPDGMYHAYNLISFTKNKARIDYLDEMLEGQVAVLSSGYLDSNEALAVLDSMKSSKLFRPDQYSYVLYPNKELPGFLSKNVIKESRVNVSTLLKKMVADGNDSLIKKDVQGQYHFNGAFRNKSNLKETLEGLKETPYEHLVVNEYDLILDIYEEVFNHKAFTGRSGTFFGYEGLGSIYWHMVSKLLLVVKEVSLKARDKEESPEIQGRLLEHFYEILAGIGVRKSPELYGAFPIDPYSHTPAGKGVQQPGMTGQVKEDILSRIGELGVFVEKGKLQFKPCLLRKTEFLSEPDVFNAIDIHNQSIDIDLQENMLAFTYCQVLVIYEISDEASVTVHYDNGNKEVISGNELNSQLSSEIFNRSGRVRQLHVHVPNEILK